MVPPSQVGALSVLAGAPYHHCLVGQRAAGHTAAVTDADGAIPWRKGGKTRRPGPKAEEGLAGVLGPENVSSVALSFKAGARAASSAAPPSTAATTARSRAANRRAALSDCMAATRGWMASEPWGGGRGWDGRQIGEEGACVGGYCWWVARGPGGGGKRRCAAGTLVATDGRGDQCKAHGSGGGCAAGRSALLAPSPAREPPSPRPRASCTVVTPACPPLLPASPPLPPQGCSAPPPPATRLSPHRDGGGAKKEHPPLL